MAVWKCHQQRHWEEVLPCGFPGLFLHVALQHVPQKSKKPLFLRGQAENLQLISQQWGKDKSLQADAATMVSNISPASDHAL